MLYKIYNVSSIYIKHLYAPMNMRDYKIAQFPLWMEK